MMSPTPTPHEINRVCSWSGPVTWRETAALREDLFDRLEASEGGTLWLDVRDVSVIDRTGVALLTGAQHRAHALQRGFVLIDTNGAVTTTLTRLHLQEQFSFEQTGIPEQRIE
jgi:anti-anti-sigma regulatory factor